MKEKDITQKLVQEGIDALSVCIKVEEKILMPVIKDVGKIIWWYTSHEAMKQILKTHSSFNIKSGLTYSNIIFKAKL